LNISVNVGGGSAAEWSVFGATVALVFATVALAVVAAVQDWVRTWFWHPRLDLSIEATPPDCLQIPLVGASSVSVNSIYLRLRVSNSGRQQANDAEVYAQRLERLVGGAWVRVPTFLPMNLKWSNTALFQPTDTIRMSVAPHMYKHCDIGSIADPGQWLRFDTIVSPTHLGNIVPPDRYRLTVFLTAANATPVQRCVSIAFDGSWSNDETTMLTTHISVGVVRCS
jgi:hypothetical protein